MGSSAFAVIVALAAGAGCTRARHDKPHPAPRGPSRAEPPTTARRHPSHEHPHGAHPHSRDAHHHHPHPHPHLDGPNGHHHPY